MEKGKKIVNVPETELPYKPLTRKELEHVCKLEMKGDSRVKRIMDEFSEAFEFMKKFGHSVTFFGSSRFKEGEFHYGQARKIAARIASELGYTVVTGGGPGIMEAANRGAKESGGKSVGFTIQLPTEQRANEYLTDSIDFYYFFTRKVAMAFAAEAYLFFPGGFGTLDEFFEIATLVQTGKIENVPIILVGNDFWMPLKSFIEETLYEKHKSISAKDLTLFTITEDQGQILDIIKSAPIREE